MQRKIYQELFEGLEIMHVEWPVEDQLQLSSSVHGKTAVTFEPPYSDI